MRNSYGFGETIKNVISFFYTKVFYKKARLIRRPFYIRGKKYLTYGNGLTTGYNCRIEMFNLNKTQDAKLIIGDNCKIGDYVHIAAGQEVKIGDNCLMASKIYISDISHGNYDKDSVTSNPYIAPDKRPLFTKPVNIEKNVWLGENVCVLPGVTIGEGSIIGANSVVSKDIPRNTIAVGAPCTPIKKYSEKNKMWERI